VGENSKTSTVTVLIQHMAAEMKSLGDSWDSESNLYSWHLMVESVPLGDRCKGSGVKALGAWWYVSPARRSESSSAWRLESSTRRSGGTRVMCFAV